MEHRCALCGRPGSRQYELTDLPGGWRCSNRYTCRERVREVVRMHQKFAAACADVVT